MLRERSDLSPSADCQDPALLLLLSLPLTESRGTRCSRLCVCVCVILFILFSCKIHRQLIGS